VSIAQSNLIRFASRKGQIVIILFGLRVFYRTIAQGTFHCRKCGGDRQYRLRVGRRWFTLFFIPVIPLDKRGEFVQCQACKTRYVPDVLNQPTTGQMQQALSAGMHAAAIAMLLSGDPASLAARQRVITLVVGAGGQGYDEAALDRDLQQARGIDALALEQVGSQLTAQAREWYLADVIRIGLADGPLTGSERAAVEAIGLGLGMTQAQVLGVVSMTEQSAGRG
jgi:hypothetical protein